MSYTTTVEAKEKDVKKQLHSHTREVNTLSYRLPIKVIRFQWVNYCQAAWTSLLSHVVGIGSTMPARVRGDRLYERERNSGPCKVISVALAQAFKQVVERHLLRARCQPAHVENARDYDVYFKVTDIFWGFFLTYNPVT